MRMDTRQLILETAERLFMQHGYASVSMSQIVAEVSKVRKLTTPAVYYHFASKEALYLAVILEMTARMGQSIGAAAAVEGDVHARVLSVARVLTREQPKNFERMSMDIEEHLGAPGREQVEHAFLEHILGPIVGVFSPVAAEGRLRVGLTPFVAAFALLGLLNGATERPHAPPPDVAAAIAVSILLDGVLLP